MVVDLISATGSLLGVVLHNKCNTYTYTLLGKVYVWKRKTHQKQVTSWAHLRPEFLDALLEEMAKLAAHLERMQRTNGVCK